MVNQSLHQEVIGELKNKTDVKKDETGGSTGYPDRPDEPDCIYYLRTGMCGYGDDCKFNHPTYIEQVNEHEDEHPERVGEPDCVYFIKTGSCKYGSTCKYNHPKDKHSASHVALNMLGLPIREEEKLCSHYLQTGWCKFGVTCKFNHPEPQLYSYPQMYLPVTSYISPVLSSRLPERPGEPECRYFMNTGTCKYGSECKYHHPMVQSDASSVLSPFGPPFRPGRTICSFYSLYGICKYGTACKYDHPLVVYSYNYTMDLTSQTMFGGTYSSTFYSSDSSSSKSLKNSECKSERTSNGKSSTEGSREQSD